MLFIKDINKLKITRVRDWRVNFKYDGVQYSLNCHEDGGESITRLTNWDTKQVITYEYGNLIVSDYIKVLTYNNYDKPLIYSHIDKVNFVKALYKNKIINVEDNIKYEITKEDLIKKMKQSIENINRELNNFKNLVRQIEEIENQ